MNFADLCTEVYTLTNRPDLVKETQVAVKAATLRAHRLDFFPKDILEQYFDFGTAAYYQQLATSLIPNFRALKYIRKYYPDSIPYSGIDTGYYSRGGNLPDGRFFKIIDPTEALNSYGVNKVDVAYLAGSIINFKSGDAFQYTLLGAYVNPDLTEAGWNSWVADSHPYAIVFDATAVVFKTIGYDEQNAAYTDLKKMEWTELQNTNILATGS